MNQSQLFSECISFTFENSLFNNSNTRFLSLVGKVTRECIRYTRVRVYRNLNKPEFYSILAMEGDNKGKVVGYAKSVLIENGQFVVGAKSRLRVLSEKRKKVISTQKLMHQTVRRIYL